MLQKTFKSYLPLALPHREPCHARRHHFHGCLTANARGQGIVTLATGTAVSSGHARGPQSRQSLRTGRAAPSLIRETLKRARRPSQAVLAVLNEFA
jgi:hypothetical protein